VLKLDIDESRLELGMVQRILEDPVLSTMIGEMMFEMHYRSPHVNQWFGGMEVLDKEWIDVLALFTALRRKGLRLHYWP
jgi:hypothetical protein